MAQAVKPEADSRRASLAPLGPNPSSSCSAALGSHYTSLGLSFPIGKWRLYHLSH